VLSNSSKIVVDQKGGGGNLLYLPLDKLMQNSGADGALKPVTPEATAPVPPPSDASSRSRDAFRSRDREPR
jgi:membrane protease subunit HflK